MRAHDRRNKAKHKVNQRDQETVGHVFKYLSAEPVSHC